VESTIRQRQPDSCLPHQRNLVRLPALNFQRSPMNTPCSPGAQVLLLGRGKTHVYPPCFLRFWKLQCDLKNSATSRTTIGRVPRPISAQAPTV
jgi:hypothetical protein